MKTSSGTANGHELTTRTGNSLFDRVVIILEQARTNVVRTVNSEMVLAYWQIGREIVQELQGGDERAGYGEKVLAGLSAKLQTWYGKGFSVTKLVTNCSRRMLTGKNITRLVTFWTICLCRSSKASSVRR